MSFGDFDSRRHVRPMAEINVVPLVDVMLVLLIVFMVTAPLLTHSVLVDLPDASSNENVVQAEHIEFGIQEDGRLFWNGEQVQRHVLPDRFAAEARKSPQPELHIHADRLAYYELVAQVMSDAARAGIGRIGFVTDPSLP